LERLVLLGRGRRLDVGQHHRAGLGEHVEARVRRAERDLHAPVVGGGPERSRLRAHDDHVTTHGLVDAVTVVVVSPGIVGAVWPGTVGGSSRATMSRDGRARIWPAARASGSVIPLRSRIAWTGR